MPEGHCDCNGLSLCNPALAAAEGGAAAIIGCTDRSLPPTTWPCEWGGEGDQNACTQEICCEPHDACRHLGESIGSTTILAGSGAECQQAGAVGGLQLATGSTGQTAACLRAGALSTPDAIALHCNDMNPCTQDVCADPTLGTCNHLPVATANPPERTIQATFLGVPVGPAVRLSGCAGDGTSPPSNPLFPDNAINYGCSRRQCQATACVVFAIQTTDGDYLDCRTEAQKEVCGRRHCQTGSCVSDPDDSRCPDDQIACTEPVCARSIPCPPNATSCPPDFICGLQAVDNQCLIDSLVCVPDGATRSGQAADCSVCDPSRSQTSWSLRLTPECAPD